MGNTPPRSIPLLADENTKSISKGVLLSKFGSRFHATSDLGRTGPHDKVIDLSLLKFSR